MLSHEIVLKNELQTISFNEALQKHAYTHARITSFLTNEFPNISHYNDLSLQGVRINAQIFCDSMRIRDAKTNVE